MKNKYTKGFVSIILICFFSLSFVNTVFAVEDSMTNKFNVVIVMDASGSMADTDPNGYRFEAVSQFVNLLTETGNNVGAVVFSTSIKASQDVSEMNGRQKKDGVIKLISGVSPTGWTNIGEALDAAVKMLDDGDPELPSVILFLSDGNTELSTNEKLELSLEQKANAIQEAREKGAVIYSVCLNADKSADVSEMKQISDATGGVFEEVSSADDLPRVFNTFYTLIYGTSSITLVDDEFPGDGVLETTFFVPGIGVEEINILIYGNAHSQRLIRPDGTNSDVEIMKSKTYSLIKESNVMPGTWTLHTEGVPGDRIRVNMVYNTNLRIDVSTSPDNQYVNQEDAITVSAFLSSGTETAARKEQLEGFHAELVMLDAFQEELSRSPMRVQDAHFEAECRLSEGTYFYYVSVKGNYVEKTSEIVGPLTVNAAVPTQEEQEEHPEIIETILTILPQNHPPQPVQDPVEYTVNIWPFKENVLEFELTSLAADEDGDALRYRIESSSFIEGTDYSVTGSKVRMNHYSLRKGAFTVSATDPGGMSCRIEVIVTSHNIGKMTLIGLGIAAVAAAAILGILTYIALTRPFLGRITCAVGMGAGTTIKPGRGRLKLSVFRLADTGIDYPNCYFQATGKKHIILKAKKPVYSGNQPTTNLQIESGHPVQIRASSNDNRTVTIKFESIIRTRQRPGSAGSGSSRYGRKSAAAASQKPKRF